MKKSILIISLLSIGFISQAQTKIEKVSDKVYKIQKDTAYLETDTFLEYKGKRERIYVTQKGKYFVNRVSKKGNPYRKYLILSNFK